MDKVTRLDQQVEEVETARFPLHILVSGDRCLQFLVQQGGKVGIASGDERIEIRLCLVAAAQDLVAR